MLYMLHLDANQLTFFSPNCHTSVFGVVSYMFMVMHNYKTIFLLILKMMFFFRQFVSDIIDGSAVQILSQCPKCTDLFVLTF